MLTLRLYRQDTTRRAAGRIPQSRKNVHCFMGLRKIHPSDGAAPLI